MNKTSRGYSIQASIWSGLFANGDTSKADSKSVEWLNGTVETVTQIATVRSMLKQF